MNLIMKSNFMKLLMFVLGGVLYLACSNYLRHADWYDRIVFSFSALTLFTLGCFSIRVIPRKVMQKIALPTMFFLMGISTLLMIIQCIELVQILINAGSNSSGHFLGTKIASVLIGGIGCLVVFVVTKHLSQLFSKELVISAT